MSSSPMGTSSPSDAASPSPRLSSRDQADPYTSDPRLTPTEAALLNEYHRLRLSLDELAASLAGLAAAPSAQMGDGLRMLERKTALVCTALKSSVYGIVLQQQIEFDGGR